MNQKHLYNNIIMISVSELKMIYNDEIIAAYIDSLSEQEKKTLQIAYEHLETSFDIYKSIGFITWKEKQSSA